MGKSFLYFQNLNKIAGSALMFRVDRFSGLIFASHYVTIVLAPCRYILENMTVNDEEESGSFLVSLMRFSLSSTFEPPHDKTNKMAFASSEDSDQHGYPPSLIRVFDSCKSGYLLYTLVLSYVSANIFYA